MCRSADDGSRTAECKEEDAARVASKPKPRADAGSCLIRHSMQNESEQGPKGLAWDRCLVSARLDEGNAQARFTDVAHSHFGEEAHQRRKSQGET